MSVESHAISRNMSEGEIREAVAEATGNDPGEIGLQGGPDEPYQYPDGTRKTSVGFSRWNSSWDPKGDPKLN